MGPKGNCGLNLGPPTGQDKIRIYPLSRSMRGRLGQGSHAWEDGWIAIRMYTSNPTHSSTMMIIVSVHLLRGDMHANLLLLPH